MRQLLTIDAIKIDEPKDLTKEYQCASLGYLTFLKEKRNDIIKWRGYFDGHKQR